MPKNQIFNFIDTPNFICSIESDFDQPHAPLIEVKLTSADTFLSFDFRATPAMLVQLSKLFAINADEIETKWKKIWQQKLEKEKNKN